MARVPLSIVPDISPAATPPADYQSIQSSPADFGGLIGASEQKAGADIGQAGSNLVLAAEIKQQRFNQVAGDDAMNTFQERGDALTHGNPNDPAAPKGLYALRGSDALAAGPGVVTQLSDLRNEIKAGLQNDAQKLQFDAQSRRYFQYKSAEISRHLDQQSDVYALAVNDAGVKAAATHAGNAFNSDEAITNALADAQGFADKSVGVRYGAAPAPDLIDHARVQARTATVLAAVDGAMASDPINGAARASQILGKFGGLIDPGVREQLTRRTRSDTENIAVAGVSQQVIGSVPAGVQAQGGATNSTWQRLKSQERGEDAQGNALASRAGATGLTQMLPSTAQETAQKHGVPYRPEWLRPGPQYDSSYADMLGRLHYSDLVTRYDGNLTLATAAYNAGAGRVDGWVSTIGDPRKGAISDADFTARIPIDETRKYVQAVAQPSALPQVSGPAPAADSDGAAAPKHNPAAYDMEMSMLTRAWKLAEDRFPDRPDLQRRAVEPVYQHIQQTNLLQAKREAEDAKAQRDAQDAVMNGVIDALTPGKIASFDPKTIANPILTPQQRISLTEFSKRALTEAGIDDTAPYGQGYAKAYNDILAPPGDPDRIGDLTEIVRRGRPGGELTGVGVQKLAQVFAATRKNPDELAISRTESSMLTYAKNRLSFEQDTGPVKIRDPKGEAIFNAQFVPLFESGLSATKQSGNPADIWKYLARDNVDKMVGSMRDPAEMARDRLAATGQMSPMDVERPGTPLPPAPTNIVPKGAAKATEINPDAWHDVMQQVPVAESGQPYTHKAWAEYLARLLGDPSTKTIQYFDQHFGGQGFSGEDIVRELTAPVRAAPTGEPEYRPMMP